MKRARLAAATVVSLVLFVALVTAGVPGKPALARTQLTILSLGGAGYQKVQDSLLDAYKAANPDVKVTINYLGWTEIQSKVLASIAGGVIPDIVMLPTRYAPSFIEQGLLSPLDYRAFGLSSEADIPKIFTPGTAGALTYKGQFYFVPCELTCLALYYNQDLLEKSGITQVPSTWEEIGAISGKLTRLGPEGIQQAALSFIRSGPFTGFWFLSFIRSAGTDWIQDGRPAFSSPTAVKALQVFADLYHKYRAAHPAFGAGNFNQGKLAFLPGLSVAIFDFRRGPLPFGLGVAPYPHLASGRPANIAYAWGYYVMSLSKNQDAAWKLVNFLTSPENAPIWMSEAKLFVPRGTTWVAELVRSDPQLRTILAGFSSATMELAHPQYDDIIKAINDASQNMIEKGLGVSLVMSELDATITQILHRK